MSTSIVSSRDRSNPQVPAHVRAKGRGAKQPHRKVMALSREWLRDDPDAERLYHMCIELKNDAQWPKRNPRWPVYSFSRTRKELLMLAEEWQIRGRGKDRKPGPLTMRGLARLFKKLRGLNLISTQTFFTRFPLITVLWCEDWTPSFDAEFERLMAIPRRTCRRCRTFLTSRARNGVCARCHTAEHHRAYMRTYRCRVRGFTPAPSSETPYAPSAQAAAAPSVNDESRPATADSACVTCETAYADAVETVQSGGERDSEHCGLVKKRSTEAQGQEDQSRERGAGDDRIPAPVLGLPSAATAAAPGGAATLGGVAPGAQPSDPGGGERKKQRIEDAIFELFGVKL